MRINLVRLRETGIQLLDLAEAIEELPTRHHVELAEHTGALRRIADDLARMGAAPSQKHMTAREFREWH